MSLTSALEAALDLALRDADAVADDVLISRDLKTAAEKIVQRHGAEPVRLHRVTIDLPRATKMAVAGDPGHETPGGSPHVVRGTAVELYVAVDGATTMAHAPSGRAHSVWAVLPVPGSSPRSARLRPASQRTPSRW